MKMKQKSDTKYTQTNQEAVRKTITTTTTSALKRNRIEFGRSASKFYCYYYYLLYHSLSFLILLNLILVVLKNAEAASTVELQLTTTSKPKPKTTSPQYPVTGTFLVSTPTSTTTTTATTPTTTSTTTTTSKNNNPLSQQSKTFKFTLTAGRFWKFNIKANSLPQASQVECANDCELRLHRNISSNNYIIDDYGWFQYNPHQQQLFAWPPLLAKPGTYYFVLLHSKLNFETADEESPTLEANDVSANIIVELLRPIYSDPDKKDIDLYLDHKFSLEYLQRLPQYPLLLSQIIIVLDSLTKSQTELTQPTQQPWTTPNPVSTTLATYLQKISKQSSRLTEVILIHYNYYSDGNLFSLTWSTHPSIGSGSISHIDHCRVSLINETVSKLSTLNSGYRSYDNLDETNIYFPLDAPPLNLQAIVPTELGNHTLKLKLNGPCQNETAIEKLVEQPALHEKTDADVDDKDNNILLDTTTRLSSYVTSTNNYKQITPDIVSSSQPSQIANNTPDSAITTAVFGNPIRLIGKSNATTTTTHLQDQRADNLLTTVPPRLINFSPSSNLTYPVPSESPKVNHGSTTDSLNHHHLQQQQPVTSSTNVVSLRSFPNSSATPLEFITTTKPSTYGLRSQSSPPISTSRRLAQPKSLEKFLSANPPEPKERSINMATNSTEVSPSLITTTMSTANVHVTPISANNGLLITTTTSTPNTTDTTINEDIMMILGDVMEYFDSIAVPVAIIVGIVLFISFIVAVIYLFQRRSRAKHFQVKDRYSFRYGSERKGFLKSSSKPVIMEADHMMISTGNTPLHKAKKNDPRFGRKGDLGESNYYPMHPVHNPLFLDPTHPESIVR